MAEELGTEGIASGARFGDALCGADGTGSGSMSFPDALAVRAEPSGGSGGAFFALPALPALPGGGREAARAVVEADPLVRVPRPVAAGAWGQLQPAPPARPSTPPAWRPGQQPARRPGPPSARGVAVPGPEQRRFRPSAMPPPPQRPQVPARSVNVAKLVLLLVVLSFVVLSVVLA